MKECPRCRRQGLHDEEALNALSRRDNKTYICPQCGDDEAMIDGRYKAIDDVELGFLAVLKKTANLNDKTPCEENSG